MSPLLSLLLEPTSILAGVVFALSSLWWLSTKRPAGLPPSPGVALPFIGHLHLLDKDPRVSFAKWRQKYGDVFSLYMGDSLVIVLNGYDVIKEALVKYGDALSDRPHAFLADYVSKGRGVVGTSGSQWKEQRKVSLEILREMGLGKNILAEKIQQEVSEYIKTIDSLQGQAFDPRNLIHISVSNNICSIVFGKRFEYDDPVFMNYMSRIEENFKLLSGISVVNFFPYLRHLPGDLFKVKRLLSNVKTVEKTLTEPQLKSHQHDYVDGVASDFIHAYLREIRQRKTSGQPTTINEENLFKLIGDLFVAGTETTSTAIRWALVFLLHNPEVQEKCFQEINRVVGTERAPCFRDKPEMVYTEATILEVLRRGNIAPLGVQHGVAYDMTFNGYTMPKGATVLTFLETALNDPKTWGDPLTFRPERFIGPDGKLTRPDEFIPFSIGRRVCLGEALSRTELFLYITTMIQRFRFVVPEGETLPSLQGTLGVTYSPQPFKICALSRDL